MSQLLAILACLGGILGLIAAAPAARAQSPDAPPPPGARWTAFDHGKHVPNEWWQPGEDQDAYSRTFPESAEDCRGCHAFEGEHDTRVLSPDVCQRCHVAGPRSFELGRSHPASLSGTTFPHGGHRELECRTCHGPRALGTAAPKTIPAALPVPEIAGVEYCRSCHATGGPTRFHVGRTNESGTRGEVREYEAGFLATKLRGADNEPVARHRPLFLHSEHVSLEGLRPGAPRSHCTQCHPGGAVQGDPSAASLDAVPFATDSCSQCHGSRMRFEIAADTRPSVTDGTFPHAAHEGAVFRGKDVTCTDCHGFGAGSAGAYGAEHDFSGDAYAACATCHEDRRVERHPEPGGCADCHGVRKPGDEDFRLATARARVAFERPLASGFAFATHGHEHFEDPSDCAACHRRSPSDVHERDTGRPFDHRVHLAPDAASAAAGSDACERCHGPVAEHTGPPAALASSVAAPGRGPLALAHVDLTACEDCHGSAARVDDGALAQHESRVFSHAAHVGRELDGAAMACSTCHAPSEADGALHFPARPSAADCTECHGHGPDARAQHPPGFGRDEALRCAACHQVGVPAADAEVHVASAVIAEQRGILEHPQGEADCSRCHVGRQGPSIASAAPISPSARAAAGTGASVRSARPFPRIFASAPLGPANYSPHSPDEPARSQRGQAGTRFHRLLSQHAQGERECLFCHWADPSKPLYYEAFKEFGTEGQIRQKWGSALSMPVVVGFDPLPRE